MPGGARRQRTDDGSSNAPSGSGAFPVSRARNMAATDRLPPPPRGPVPPPPASGPSLPGPCAAAAGRAARWARSAAMAAAVSGRRSRAACCRPCSLSLPLEADGCTSAPAAGRWSPSPPGGAAPTWLRNWSRKEPSPANWLSSAAAACRASASPDRPRGLRGGRWPPRPSPVSLLQCPSRGRSPRCCSRSRSRGLPPCWPSSRSAPRSSSRRRPPPLPPSSRRRSRSPPRRHDRLSPSLGRCIWLRPLRISARGGRGVAPRACSRADPTDPGSTLTAAKMCPAAHSAGAPGCPTCEIAGLLFASLALLAGITLPPIVPLPRAPPLRLPRLKFGVAGSAVPGGVQVGVGCRGEAAGWERHRCVDWLPTMQVTAQSAPSSQRSKAPSVAARTVRGPPLREAGGEVGQRAPALRHHLIQLLALQRGNDGREVDATMQAQTGGVSGQHRSLICATERAFWAQTAPAAPAGQPFTSCCACCCDRLSAFSRQLAPPSPTPAAGRARAVLASPPSGGTPLPPSLR